MEMHAAKKKRGPFKNNAGSRLRCHPFIRRDSSSADTRPPQFISLDWLLLQACAGHRKTRKAATSLFFSQLWHLLALKGLLFPVDTLTVAASRQDAPDWHRALVLRECGFQIGGVMLLCHRIGGWRLRSTNASAICWRVDKAAALLRADILGLEVRGRSLPCLRRDRKRGILIQYR